MARFRPARRGLRAACTAALVIVAAGCSTAPSGGGTTEINGRSSQVQAYTLPLPPPKPTSAWKPYEVVLAFLHASATYDLDPAAARQYLTGPARRNWNPVSVTVVRAPTSSQFVTVPSEPQIPRSGGQPAQALDQVTFTGDKLATLSQSGQYQPSSGSASYQFQLAQGANGVWLIDSIAPSDVWLLTQSDFGLVYQPRNLFFFAPPEPGTDGVLVPDPVFAPIQVSDTALNTSLATGLVQGLIHDRSSWLSGGTSTAFPAGTTLIGGEVSISGPAAAATAVVNLGGNAAQASSILKVEMQEQLQATLDDTSYSSTPVATSVQLEINGHPWYPGNVQDLVPEVYAPVGGLSVPEPWFAETAGLPPITQFGPARGAAVQEPVPGHVSQSAITALAVSPGAEQDLAVAVQVGRGCELEVGSLSGETPKTQATYQLTGSTGPCTSLSWNNNGTNSSLWAVAGGRIWVVPQQSQEALPVADPVWPGAGLAGSQILALRMAPDSVRAAFLVSGPSGDRLMLAAVNDNGESFGPAVAVGTGLPDPKALSWYDPYHLAVLASGEIYDVPLTGSEGTQLGFAPAGAQTLTTDGRLLLVGTSRGEVQSATATSMNWRFLADGINPIYPG